MALRLFTLGQLRLSGPEGDLLPGRRMELALLTYLARRPGERVERVELATLFWGEKDEAKARQSLRHALLKLRRTLNEGLEITPESVRLAERVIELDAAAFEQDLARGQLRDAVARWEGAFLAPADGLGGEQFRVWVEAERERLRRRMIRALQQLERQALDHAGPAEAVRWARRWTEIDPLEEEAHARLIEALRLAGRHEEAEESFALYRRRALQELGSEPSARLVALAKAAAEPARPTLHGPAGRSSAALFTPNLVGRGAEFSVLMSTWREVQAAGVGVVLVEGSEGIGKTRFCEEFLRVVAAPGANALVLRARAHAAEQDTAGSAARELLGSLAKAPGLAGSADDALAELSALVPAIRARFPHLPEPRGLVPLLHDAVRRVLADVAAEVPLVLFLDDATFADAASWQLLLACARHPVPGVLLLIACTGERHTDGGPGDLWDVPALQRLSLQPLTADEVGALLASMFHSPVEPLDDLAARVHTEAEGNPFHAVALVSALADLGQIAPDAHGAWRVSPDLAIGHLPLPGSVRDAVRARLDRLGPGARRVLDAAAVLGRRMDTGLLEAVAQSSDFAAALDELISRRLLREAPGAVGTLEFTHEALRRVAYQLLGPGRRQALHRAAAAVLLRPGMQNRERRAALRHHREHGGLGGRGPRVRARAAVALLSGLLLLVALAAVTRSRGSPAAPLSPATVAVLPFSVRGSEAYDYLREGMVDMLSSRLDGAGELRAVDPRALLAYLRRIPGDARAPDAARGAAQHLGAGLYVLGTVTAAGGRLQLSATLYDVHGTPQATAQTEAADESRFFELLDDLAAQLLADRYRSPTDALTGMAVRTTASFPALKAFLDGERHLRSGNFLPAYHAFEQATLLDSTFSLAFYRLSVAGEWGAVPAPILDATATAELHAARLAPHARQLVQALRASRQGEAKQAEEQYRKIVQSYPDDVEAWLQLGEVLFHYNPLRGRSIAGSREAWQRVLAYEPENPVALMHLARIAAVEENSADLGRYLERMRAAVPEPDRRLIEVAALHALATGDHAAADSVLTWLRQHPDTRMTIPLLHVATFSRNLVGAQHLLGATAAAGATLQHRAWGHLHRAYLLLGQGRRRAAQAELAALAALDPPVARIHRAFMASLPFASIPAPAALRLREELHPRYREPLRIFHHSLYPAPQVWEYLLGSLSLAAGDTREVLDRIHALERLAGTASDEEMLAGDLALGLRARLTRERGEPEASLALLEQARMQAIRGTSAESPFLARAAERWLRAELLEELGRDEEAIRWYATLGELSPYEIAFVAPAHLRRAGIHDRRGERQQALHHYRRFIDLWKDADPEVQPLVRQASQRIRELE